MKNDTKHSTEIIGFSFCLEKSLRAGIFHQLIQKIEKKEPGKISKKHSSISDESIETSNRLVSVSKKTRLLASGRSLKCSDSNLSFMEQQ